MRSSVRITYYVERGETLRAARSATWIGMNLAYRGLIGPATGWLGRAQRLLESWPEQTAEHGLLMLPLIFQNEAAGDFEQAAAVARERRQSGSASAIATSSRWRCTPKVTCW